MDSHTIVCSHCGTTNRVLAARVHDQPACGRCKGALLPGSPVAVNGATFDAIVARTDVPVVVDFWAPWCGPCRAMAPQFEAAATALQGEALLLKVNTDENPDLAARFAIRSIPTLAVFAGGALVRQTAGAMGANDLVRWVRD